MLESPWGKYSPEGGSDQTIEIGPLKIYLQWVSNEIWVAFKYSNWPAMPDDEIVGELKWSRWALQSEKDEIEIVPTLSQLPLLLKPDDPYRILPNAQTRIYARIPLWVHLRTVKDQISLIDIPTVVQSNTWFGSTIDGELCLSHASRVRRFLTDDFFLPHLVSCTIQIRNASVTDLQFDKICLRPDRMSIYTHNGHLWSDETNVIYRGVGAEGDVNVSGKPPIEVKDAKLIGKPRVSKSTNLAVRTFSLLRDIRLF